MSKRIQIGNLFLDLPDFPQKISYVLPLVITLLVCITSIYTIDANEQGVVLTLGKYSRTTEPGIHLKIPFWIERVYKVRVDYQYKQQKRTSSEYDRRKSTNT